MHACMHATQAIYGRERERREREREERGTQMCERGTQMCERVRECEKSMGGDVSGGGNGWWRGAHTMKC